VKVLLIFRAPLGGLFRHVLDLMDGLRAAGHDVAVVFDSGTTLSDEVASRLQRGANLGVTRFSIPRLPSPTDLMVIRKISDLHRKESFDVVHGHGAKGGLYARLLAMGNSPSTAVFYTLHGGSLHYSKKNPVGALFLATERFLLPRTSGIIFESLFAKRRFQERIAAPPCPTRVIYNGIHDREFEPAPLAADPSDFVFLGELRRLKGVDLLLRAMHVLQQKGRRVSLAIFGSGPDEAAFKELADHYKVRNLKWMGPAACAREALINGRCLVLPSRAESLSYVAIEALGMQVPVIATRVGGLPEVFGDDGLLIQPDNVPALAQAMERVLDSEAYDSRRGRLFDRAKSKFSVSNMIADTISFYASVIERSLERTSLVIEKQK
jgi:glycosyltransferase involved in cell wall biosynthesis